MKKPFFSILILIFVFSANAATSTRALDFDPIWSYIMPLMQGSLGKTISISFGIIGLMAAVCRLNILAIALIFAVAMGLYVSPIIIENVFSATLPR
ncbi:TraA family conjugative transfer protein [Photobacterium ganghwense]|uniref:TraA family conjugative transfer protein n=1 Tax=Photobacterium ganghwense TaxID=320778 RepID=UPI001A8F7F0A|nr:TraA family conjugative transfer protein [Photobacterium ganghwense]QSV17661.1 hypothetical protein FH974_25595 [Photobacterium ganghwense]